MTDVEAVVEDHEVTVRADTDAVMLARVKKVVLLASSLRLSEADSAAAEVFLLHPRGR